MLLGVLMHIMNVVSRQRYGQNVHIHKIKTFFFNYKNTPTTLDSVFTKTYMGDGGTEERERENKLSNVTLCLGVE